MTTSRVQALRFSGTTTLPAAGARLPGELWCNLADLQLGVIDALKNPQKLVAVRFFSASATYAAGDIVVQAGQIWTAGVPVLPGPFNSAQWTTTTSTSVLDGPAGTPRKITGSTDGLYRWALYLGDSAPETGGNLGSDFGVNSYDDSGAYLQTNFLLNRQTGLAVFNAVAATQWSRIGPSPGSMTMVLNKAPGAGFAANIGGAANGVLRWNFLLGDGSAETGSNAGSDFSLGSYSDAGAPLSTCLRIQRLTGHMTVNANNATLPPLGPPSKIGNAVIGLNKAVGTSACGLDGHVNGVLRWQVMPGNAVAETGGNTGSNFEVVSYDDTGTRLGSPLTIGRGNGFVAINGAGAPGSSLSSVPLGSAVLALGKAASGQGNAIYGTTNGAPRWQVNLGEGTAETGSSAGSNFTVAAYSDAGASTVPLSIARATGVATFAQPIVNGPSDRALKENIAPIADALDKVLALQGVSFNMIATPGKPEIGLIAQDVEPIVPEIVQDFQTHDSDGMPAGVKLALDYPKLVALLVEAVKTLAARVTAIEGAAA